MAYAYKTDTAVFRKGLVFEGAWFGYTPPFVPSTLVKKTDDADNKKAAQAHLERAIQRYREAVKLAPNDLPARLGLAWAIEQSGDKEQALKDYRKLVADAWAKEKTLDSLPLGGHSVTAEAAGYLIAMLDKDKDKEEIATLEERRKKMNALPRPVTPLVIPLRDGLRVQDLEDRTASVAFDADGSGLKRRWTWVTKDAGWLVYTPRGQSKVESALQMFGSVSFWLFWDNGYQALAALDDDGDGMLRGKELESLAIWHDADGNGVCDPGEVKPLSAHGIAALSCRCERDASHPDRIAFSRAGVVLRDGRTRSSYDIILHRREAK
jgi:tetratricopeptide (TPR) repeat protein